MLTQLPVRQGILHAPVKIAVLDTGAKFNPQTLKVLYDDRLGDCRTWRYLDCNGRSTKTSADSDQDGHGTHTTSLLLDVTQDTDCQVFVAQVFGTRRENRDTTQNADIQGGIANVSTASSYY